MACLYGEPFFQAVGQMLSVRKLINIGQTIFFEPHHNSRLLPLKWQPSILMQIIFWVDFSYALC
jgi:hypothetical protein